MFYIYHNFRDIYNWFRQESKFKLWELAHQEDVIAKFGGLRKQNQLGLARCGPACNPGSSLKGSWSVNLVTVYTGAAPFPYINQELKHIVHAWTPIGMVVLAWSRVLVRSLLMSFGSTLCKINHMQVVSCWPAKINCIRRFVASIQWWNHMLTC